MIELTEVGKLNMASTVTSTGGRSLNEKKKASWAPEFISAADKELNVSSYSMLLYHIFPITTAYTLKLWAKPFSLTLLLLGILS